MPTGLLWAARVSSGIAAIVWVVGLLFVAQAGVIPSDAEYFWFGAVSSLLGLTMLPVTVGCAWMSVARLRPHVLVSGLTACLAVIVTGVLLTLGARGQLGDRAPGWLSDAASLSPLAFFLWVLLASYGMRASAGLGRDAFRLGVLAAASALIPAAGLTLLFFVNPGFVITNVAIPLDFLFAVLFWLSLPAWLLLLAIRLRP